VVNEKVDPWRPIRAFMAVVETLDSRVCSEPSFEVFQEGKDVRIRPHARLERSRSILPPPCRARLPLAHSRRLRAFAYAPSLRAYLEAVGRSLSLPITSQSHAAVG